MSSSTEPTKLDKQYRFEYDITMTCGGCSGAIERVLKRLQAENKIYEYSVSLSAQRVGVNGDNIHPADLYLALKKTGKTINKCYVNGRETRCP